MDIVKSLCLDKSKCAIPVSNDEFKGDPCFGTVKSLAVQVKCSVQQKYSISVDIPVGTMAEVHVQESSQNFMIYFLYLSHSFQAGKTDDISESGKTIWTKETFTPTKGINAGKRMGNDVVLTVLSGAYHFNVFST